MKYFKRIALITLACFFTSSVFATTYKYEGPPLNGLTAGDYSSGNKNITGWIKTSGPIPTDSVELDITSLVTDWSFSDGVVSISSSNSDSTISPVYGGGGVWPSEVPLVSTDPVGNIIAARIIAYSSPLNSATNNTLQIQGIARDNFARGDIGNKSGTCASFTGGVCDFYNLGSDYGFSAIDATGTWTIAIEESISDIVDSVTELNIDNGVSTALDSKLMTALAVVDDINDKNDHAAINKLYAFIANVDAQSGKMIPDVEAAALIAEAQAVIDALVANQ